MTNHPPPTGETAAREPLGALRILLIIVGAASVLFSGGCSLFMLSDGMGIWPLVLAFGGAPFVLGLLIIWMALRLGRGPVPGNRAGRETAE